MKPPVGFLLQNFPARALIDFSQWFFKTRPVSVGGPESKICFGPGLTENHSKTTTWMKETREISPSIINANQNCPLWDDMPQHLCKNLCQDHSMKSQRSLECPTFNDITSMKASRRSRSINIKSITSQHNRLLLWVGGFPQKNNMYIYICNIYNIYIYMISSTESILKITPRYQETIGEVQRKT